MAMSILLCGCKFLSGDYIHFWTNTFGKDMNPLILPAMGSIVSLLFFYKDIFGIKQPIKVDMPLNQNLIKSFYLLCDWPLKLLS